MLKKAIAPIIEIGLNPLSECIASITIAHIMQAIPNDAKMIPPLSSCFQEIKSRASKTNEGMLCISNPINIWLKPEAESKTSKEKIARKSANTIRIILGAQNKVLLIFLFILIHCAYAYIMLAI